MAKYLWFFPVYIAGYVLVERFPLSTEYHVMHCALDDIIPFCEYFVVPYYLWHILILAFTIYTLKNDKQRFEKFFRFLIVCCFIVFAIFMFFPTCQNMRPEVFPRDNIFTDIVKITYLLDTSTNVCPSMHVIGCFGLLFTCWDMDKMKSTFGRFIQILLFILISLSTLCLKQHSCLDVLAALPVSVLGWWISYSDPKKFENERIKEMLGVIFVKGKVFTIPNIMSVFRLCLLPFIIYVYDVYCNPYLATALVVVSGITDVLDGYIARKYQMITDFGKILDPVADKLTQLTLIYILSKEYPAMWILICIIIFKELVQITFGYLMLQKNMVIHSSQWFGKISTVLLYATTVCLILFSNVSSTFANAAVGVCAVFLILALILYSRYYLKELYPHTMYKVRDFAIKAVAISFVVLLLAAVLVNVLGE